METPHLPKLMGARVKRVEDARLLTGQGRYVDDIEMPGMVHMALVRSPHAAARLMRVDVEEARALPGVIAVWTFEECPITLWERPAFPVGQPALARGAVRYVGEPVVAVFAEDRYVAEDAADLVEIDYEPTEAVMDMTQSLQDRPGRVHADTPNRYWHEERETDGFAAAFHGAPHTLHARFHTHRQAALSMEPRGLVAAPDALSGRLTVHPSTQLPHTYRQRLAALLGLEDREVRVVVPEVGGAFGMKASIYPEDVLVSQAALTLGRPVKWFSDRRESLLGDTHSRDAVHEVDAAFDGEGHVLALYDHIYGDGGAYPAYPYSGAIDEASMAGGLITGPYRIPHVKTEAECVFSNKTPLGAYRGVWGPIATWVQEGVMERVAQALGRDVVDIRRVNMIRDEDFPYENPGGWVYDRGSYLESLDVALAMVDYSAFRVRQQEWRAEGRWIGLGIAVFVEPTAMAPSGPGTPYESATIRMEPSGAITAALGLGPSGQGHETTMAQLIADELGVPLNRISILHGDTDSAPFGGGTEGSRSGPMGGGATLMASRQLKRRLQRIAAFMLEASVEDITFADGKAFPEGVPSRAVRLEEIARVAYGDVDRLPPDVPIGLEVLARYRPATAATFSNGTHIAIVEVMPTTGLVRCLKYVVVNDCGQIINPAIVEGQIQGGVAQGIGEAWLEELQYDTTGQLLTGSLLDYLVPTTADVPRIEIRHLVTPSAGEGGIKGMGEGALIAAPAALANAVSDALAPQGFVVERLPMRPQDLLAKGRKNEQNV